MSAEWRKKYSRAADDVNMAPNQTATGPARKADPEAPDDPLADAEGALQRVLLLLRVATKSFNHLNSGIEKAVRKAVSAATAAKAGAAAAGAATADAATATAAKAGAATADAATAEAERVEALMALREELDKLKGGAHKAQCSPYNKAVLFPLEKARPKPCPPEKLGLRLIWDEVDPCDVGVNATCYHHSLFGYAGQRRGSGRTSSLRQFSSVGYHVLSALVPRSCVSLLRDALLAVWRTDQQLLRLQLFFLELCQVAPFDPPPGFPASSSIRTATVGNEERLVIEEEVRKRKSFADLADVDLRPLRRLLPLVASLFSFDFARDPFELGHQKQEEDEAEAEAEAEAAELEVPEARAPRLL